MKHLKLEKSFEIKARPQEIFDLLTNPARMAGILPGIFEVSFVPELPLQEGSRFNYKYHLGDLTISGEWTVEEIKAPELYVARTKGLGGSTWKHVIHDTGSASILEITFEYEIPAGILSDHQEEKIMSLNQENLDRIGASLKAELEK